MAEECRPHSLDIAWRGFKPEGSCTVALARRRDLPGPQGLVADTESPLSAPE